MSIKITDNDSEIQCCYCKADSKNSLSCQQCGVLFHDFCLKSNKNRCPECKYYQNWAGSCKRTIVKKIKPKLAKYRKTFFQKSISILSEGSLISLIMALVSFTFVPLFLILELLLLPFYFIFVILGFILQIVVFGCTSIVFSAVSVVFFLFSASFMGLLSLIMGAVSIIFTLLVGAVFVIVPLAFLLLILYSMGLIGG